MKIGIQYYYCCKQSDYDVFEVDETVETELIEQLKNIYDGDMTEINFTSKKFELLTVYIVNNNESKTELCNVDGYCDCDYQFLYIICQ